MTLNACRTSKRLTLGAGCSRIGVAFGDADPVHALNAVRRGLVVAQDSGNRGNETHLASTLCRVEAKYGDPLAAFD